MAFLFQQKKILTLFLFVTFLAGFLGINTVQANFLPMEDTLEPDEEVLDDLYLQGTNVTVAGKVHGMLFVVGEQILLDSTAEIDNDIFILGKNIVVEEGAKISGNLFIAGQNIIIKSSISSNLLVASATLDLASTASVGKNIFFAGFHAFIEKDSVVKDNFYAGCYQISLAGTIEDNLRVSAVSVDLKGNVLKNADIMIDASGDDEGIRILYPYLRQFNIPDLLPAGLVVGENASIQGKLIYTSAKSLGENLKSLPLGGVIENIKNENAIDNQKNIIQKNPFLLRILKMLRQSVGFLLFAFLVWKFGRKYISETVYYATKKPLQSFGSGFLSILVVYIGSMVFLVLLVLITLLLRFFTLNQLSSYLFFFGISLNILLMVLMAILIMYISKLVVAFWAGKLFLARFYPKQKSKEVWGLVSGVIIYSILNLIPVFGWILGVVISLIGIGAIWYTMQNHDRAGILPDFD